jgi:hypothetical protein
MGSGAPLMPLAEAWASGCSLAWAPATAETFAGSSHGLALSYREHQASSGRRSRARSLAHPRVGSSLEVSSPTAFLRTERRLSWTGLPHLTACVFGFSRPPDVFVRPAPTSPVSCWIRSWGLSLQSISLSRSRTPSPAPLPSCRCERPHDPSSASDRVAGAEAPRHKPTRLAEKSSAAPSPSGLCSTRESATTSRLFRPSRSTWLSWDFSPPGCSPSPAWHDLHRASPHEVARPGGEPTCHAPLQGLTTVEVGWSLSRLPTLLGFLTS